MNAYLHRAGSRRFAGSFFLTGFALALALMILCGERASGAVYYWDANGSAAWTTGTAWSPNYYGYLSAGATPGQSDIAVFDGINGSGSNLTSGTATINLTAATSASGLVFVTNTNEVLIQTSSTTGASQTLTIGSNGIWATPSPNLTGILPVIIGSNTANQGVSVVLGANQVWTNNSIGDIDVLNGVAGSSSLPTTNLTINNGYNTPNNGGEVFEGVIANGGGGNVTSLSINGQNPGGFVTTSTNVDVGTITTTGAVSALGATVAVNSTVGLMVGQEVRAVVIGTGTLSALITAINSATTFTIGSTIASGTIVGTIPASTNLFFNDIGATVLNNQNTYTGNTTVGSGMLYLNFNSAVASGSYGYTAFTSNIISSSSQLDIGGGAYNYSGQEVYPVLEIAGGQGTDSQTFNGTILNAGLSYINELQNDSTSLTVNLGGLARNAGAVLDLQNVPTATLVTTVSSTNGNDVSGTILGPWAIYGTPATGMGYVAVNGSHDLVAATGTFAAGSNLSNMTAANATENFYTTAANTLTTSASGNTLEYNSATANTTALGTNTLTVNGILNQSTGGFTVTSSTSVSGTGAIIIGPNDGNELVIAGSNVTLDAPIENNGATAGSVTYAGYSGTVNAVGNTAITVNGTNTYTGTTYFSSGEVVISNVVGSGSSGIYGDTSGAGSALGDGGPITFTGGAVKPGNGVFGQNAYVYGENPFISSVNGGAPVGDFSSRIKNSTAPITIDLSGLDFVMDGNVDSSNTAGMIFNDSGGTVGVVINGSNSYTGNTFLDGGSVIYYLGSNTPFGNGGTVYGVASLIYATTPVTIANNFEAEGGTFKFTGTNNITLSGIVGEYSGQGGRAFGSLMYDGASLTLSGTVMAAAGIINAPGSMNFPVQNNSTTYITGVIASGLDNTNEPNNIDWQGYGTVILSNSNTSTGAYGIEENMTMILNFGGTNAPLSQIIGRNTLTNPEVFTNGDDTFELEGAAGQANSEFINNIKASPGVLQLVLNPQGATSLSLNMGNLEYGNTLPAFYNFNLGGETTSTSSAANGFLSTITNSGGGIIPAATVNGNDWATAVATTGLGGTNEIVAYSNYAAAGSGISFSGSTGGSATNFTNTGGNLFSANNAMTASGTINSVKFNANAGDTLTTSGKLLGITDGVLVTGSVSGQTIALGTSGDFITGGNETNYDGNALLIVNNGVNGTVLNIGAAIQNNSVGALNVALSGSGLTVISGNAMNTGTTWIEGPGVVEAGDSVNVNATAEATASIAASAASFTVGSATGIPTGTTLSLFGPGVAPGTTGTINGTTFYITSGSIAASIATSVPLGFGTISTGANANLSGSSNLSFAGGVLGLTGNFSRALGVGQGEVQFGYNAGGFAAMNNGVDVVALGGTAGIYVTNDYLTSGSLTQTLQGANSLYAQALTLGAPSAQGMVNFTNNISINNTSYFVVNVIKGQGNSPAVIASGDPLAGMPIDAQLSGTIANATSNQGFTINGNGTLALTGSDTFSGPFTILGGIVTLAGTGGTFGHIGNSIATQIIVDGSNSVLDLGNNTGTEFEDNASGPLTVSNGGELLGSGNSAVQTQEYLLQSGSVSAILNGAGTGDIVKYATGTLSISSSNTGNAVNGGMSGGVYLSAGQLNVDNNYALGLGPLYVMDNAFANTAFGNTSGGPITIVKNNQWFWNGNFAYNGSGNTFNTGNGVVLLGTNVNVAVNYSSGSASANTFTVGGAIGGGTNGLTKSGSGTLVLGGNTTYTGTTSVLAGTLSVAATMVGPAVVQTGTLIVTGKISGATNVLGGGVLNVNSSGQVAGNTTVGDPSNPNSLAILAGAGLMGNVTVGAATSNTGAEIAPSYGLGTEGVGTGTTLETGSSFTILANSGASVVLQIGRSDSFNQTNGAGADSSDHIIVGVGASAMAPTLSGNLQLSLESGYTPVVGDVLYLIINNSFTPGTVSGMFATVNGSAISGGQFSYDGLTWGITTTASYAGNSFTTGNDVAIEALPVPEPGTWAMLIAGCGVLLVIHRRRGRLTSGR